MTHSTVRHKIRTQIRPFPKVATYPTSWAGPQTFRQIYDDLAHYASNVMKSYGIHRTSHLPDCLQNGFMALWVQLTQDNDFLARKSRQQTVYFVLARCKISSFRRYDDNYDSLEEIVSLDWRANWDEHTITGLSTPKAWYRSTERWATWATKTDIRIDVERIMTRLADKYADSLGHLAALYYLTTQVTRIDAATISGVSVHSFARTFIKPVRRELLLEFGNAFLEQHNYAVCDDKKRVSKARTTRRHYLPYREWREQYRRGNTAPAVALIDKYSHTVCTVGAIEAQLEGKSYRQAALDLGRNPKTFPRYMKRAAQMLAAAYA